MLQGMSNMVDTTCSSVMQCPMKSEPQALLDVVVASNGNEFDEECNLPATSRRAGGVSQAQRSRQSDRPKETLRAHSKRSSNSSSNLGFRNMKFERCWSSDDVGIAFKMKYKRMSRFDSDHNNSNEPATPFLPFLPVPISSQRPFHIIGAQIQPSYNSRAQPGWKSPHSKDCGPFVEADVVSVHPSVLIGYHSLAGDVSNLPRVQHSTELRIEDHGSGSLPCHGTLPVPFIRRLSQSSQNSITFDSNLTSAKVPSDLPILDGFHTTISPRLPLELVANGGVDGSGIFETPQTNPSEIQQQA
jgi:hypothetical protein